MVHVVTDQKAHGELGFDAHAGASAIVRLNDPGNYVDRVSRCRVGCGSILGCVLEGKTRTGC